MTFLPPQSPAQADHQLSPALSFLFCVAKILVVIICFSVGVMMGILEMLFFDRRRHTLDK